MPSLAHLEKKCRNHFEIVIPSHTQNFVMSNYNRFHVNCYLKVTCNVLILSTSTKTFYQLQLNQLIDYQLLLLSSCHGCEHIRWMKIIFVHPKCEISYETLSICTFSNVAIAILNFFIAPHIVIDHTTS